MACPICGTMIKLFVSQIKASMKYCSRKCRILGRTGSKSPVWKGGRVITNCPTCNKQVTAQRSRFKKTGHKFCSRKCFHIWRSENLRGQNCKGWRGGKEHEKERKRLYEATHREQRRQHVKRYRKTIKGINAMKKCHAKRKKNFGFLPINKPFPNSHGHHINTEHVIYIPAEIHSGTHHSVKQNLNMDLINQKAFTWLSQGLMFINR